MSSSLMLFYQRLQRLTATFVIAAALLLVINACDSTVTDPGLQEEEDPEEVVVTDDAVVVDRESTPIQRVAGDTLVFQLSDASPAFEPGNVIVGEEGEGFLRRVVEVDVSGNEAVLITEAASLVDVVERGTLQESFDLSATTRAGLQWQVTHTEEGVTADAGVLGLELEEVALPGITGLSVTFTNGNVSFDPDIDFHLQIRRGRLNEMLVAASGQLDFNVDVEVTATQEIVRKDSTLLARFDGQPITFLIGFVPVVILPTLEFIAGYEVELGQEGSITSGLESVNSITAGAEYKDGNWLPILDRGNTIEPRPLIWDQTATAEAKGYIRPKLSFEVYGVAGPFINTNMYMRIQATVSPPSWAWGVYGGLDGNFGGEVEIFDNVLAKYEHKFAQVEWELAGESGEFGGDTEATISGLITDTESGKGIANANVTGSDLSTGAEVFGTTTDASGGYTATFTVEETPEKIEITARANDYDDATNITDFEGVMVLDLALNPSDDAQGGEATVSGQIIDDETGTGIEGATVSGFNAETGEGLFETTTNDSGEFETSYLVETNPSDIRILAQTDGYVSTEKTIPFDSDIEGILLYLSAIDGSVVYAENFEDNPNYSVRYSGNTKDEAEVRWDTEQENYSARVRDQTSDWWSIGISPSFEKIYPEDSFVLSFRFNPVEPDWGHYPSIYLVDSELYDPEGDLKNAGAIVAAFGIYWSDNRYKLFGFGSGDNRHYSPTIPNENEWYTVTVEYDGSTQTTDLLILREDGQVFVDEENLGAVPMGAFDQFWIGEVGGGPSYGNEARIQVDDLKLIK